MVRTMTTTDPISSGACRPTETGQTPVPFPVPAGWQVKIVHGGRGDTIFIDFVLQGVLVNREKARRRVQCLTFHRTGAFPLIDSVPSLGSCKRGQRGAGTVFP